MFHRTLLKRLFLNVKLFVMYAIVMETLHSAIVNIIMSYNSMPTFH